MLSPDCLTSCAVPNLCAIACPFNKTLEQGALEPDDRVAADEPLVIEIEEPKLSAPNSSDNKKS